MDQDFLLRAQRLLADQQPAPVDHGILVATISAQQAASATAQAQAQARAWASEAAEKHSNHPLVELLLAGPDWREAASAQQGCFSRPATARRVKGS